MKIFDYIKSLFPRLTKPKISEDLRITSSELDTVVLPAYKNAADFFKINKLMSDEAKELSMSFYLHYNTVGGKKANVVEEIYKKLENVKANVDFILEQAEALLERDIIREGLTAKQTVLIRAAENMSYISRYSIDFLNYMYTCEEVFLGVEGSVVEHTSVAVNKAVTSNASRFALLLNDYGVPNEKFIKSFNGVPEVVLDGVSKGATASMFHEQEIDPFAGSQLQGFMGFSGNPIYHFRLMEAEWQASRFKANKEKKKLLEFRLLHLKLLQEDKVDPKIEEEIEYIQGRVEKLERYLKEVEESLQ